MSKPWYQSVTIWLNVVSVIIALLGYVLDKAAAFHLTTDMVTYFGALVFVLNLVVRFFLTSQPIAGSPKAK